MPAHPGRGARARVALMSAVLLLLTGCSGRGSAETERVADAATRFLATLASAPELGCDLLAPATLEQLESDGEQCADALGEVASDTGRGSGEPRVDVFGRDAMVRWAGATLFLARFDDGWRVTAAGCEPRGDDLPYDCAVEGR